MEIQFKTTTDEGPVEFYGRLSPEEVKTLLVYALVNLIRTGILPLGQHHGTMSLPPFDDEGQVIKQ